jgi:hypothetical protein
MAQEIQENMRSKPSDELLTIWILNDRERWSDEAFDAARLVLTERGVCLPEQGPRKEACVQPPSSASAPPSRAKSNLGTVLLLFGVLGLIGALVQFAGAVNLKGDPAYALGALLGTFSAVMHASVDQPRAMNEQEGVSA